MQLVDFVSQLEPGYSGFLVGHYVLKPRQDDVIAQWQQPCDHVFALFEKLVTLIFCKGDIKTVAAIKVFQSEVRRADRSHVKDAVERVSPFAENVLLGWLEVHTIFQKVIQGTPSSIVEPFKQEPVQNAFSIALVGVFELMKVGLALLIELSLKWSGGHKLYELISELVGEQELAAAVVWGKS